jgi:hypothetical protein
MIRKGLKPGFRIGLDRFAEQGVYRRAFPFRKSWVAITILLAMDVAFILPAVFTFRQVIESWAGFDSLFDLVIALFLSAWLLGWSTAPIIMTSILLLMLFGREVIRVGPGAFEIFLGLPVLGVIARYDVAKMRNLRLEKPAARSRKSWRGPHFCFDYGANRVAFGSSVSDGELVELGGRIQSASGVTIRQGDALPEEMAANWDPVKDSDPSARVDEEPVAGPALTLASPSTVTLIIANLVPLAGTVFLGWNLSDVMVLYWAESAVIGFFNVCKMAVIGRWGVLLTGPFFIGHFGGFMAVHFLFIYTLFVKGLEGGESSAGNLDEVAQLFVNLWPALLALFLSHAFSFYRNFLGRNEYRGRTMRKQMSEPYSRIIFMHLVIIFGGGLSLFLGEPAPVLLIVIGLKIIFDVKAHLKEHDGRSGRKQESGSH